MGISEFWKRFTLALRESQCSDKQVDIATQFSVAQPSVHKWKTGKNFPEPEKLIEIGHALGVCVEWLYTGRGSMHPVVLPGSTDDDLLSLFRSLSEQDKQEVLRFAQFRGQGSTDT